MSTIYTITIVAALAMLALFAALIKEAVRVTNNPRG